MVSTKSFCAQAEFQFPTGGQQLCANEFLLFLPSQIDRLLEPLPSWGFGVSELPSQAHLCPHNQETKLLLTQLGDGKQGKMILKMHAQNSPNRKTMRREHFGCFCRLKCTSASCNIFHSLSSNVGFLIFLVSIFMV